MLLPAQTIEESNRNDTNIVCLQVCDALGVELRVVPMTQQYWERVVAHSVREIREGRTPNPDMLCNSCVKFGEEHTQGPHAQPRHAVQLVRQVW